MVLGLSVCGVADSRKPGCELLFLRTMGEAGPVTEECPFCRTTIRPGAIVCTGCGAFKDRRMGCTGCLALLSAVLFFIGALFMLALFPASMDQGTMGVIVIVGLVYAGLAALCYWALAWKTWLEAVPQNMSAASAAAASGLRAFVDWDGCPGPSVGTGRTVVGGAAEAAA